MLHTRGLLTSGTLKAVHRIYGLTRAWVNILIIARPPHTESQLVGAVIDFLLQNCISSAPFAITMRLDAIWTGLVYVLDILTFSSTADRKLAQSPLTQPSVYEVEPIDHDSAGKPPEFEAPKNPQSGEPFVCHYPQMPEFENCHSPTNRACWLKEKHGPKIFDINSNYEILKDTPTGIVRKVRTNSDAPLA
jgi:hypothetical protein